MTDQDSQEFALEKYREYLAAIDDSWNRWLDALDRLSAEEIDSPGTCGEWSVRDLVGHIAVWDQVAIDKVLGIREGNHPPEDDESLDQFNERTVEVSRSLELDVIRERMISTHEKLIEDLADVSNLPVEILERIEWATVEDTRKHYQQHLDQIEVRFHRDVSNS
jgi:uncharacterized damage-inducible protein DinB